MPRRIVCTLILSLAAGTAAAQDMPLTQVLLDGENWKLVSEGHKFTEGPAADAEGNVYFVDVPTSQIFKIDTSDKVTVFAENAGRPSGLSIGPDGKLYACQSETKRVVRYDAPGQPPQIIGEEIGVNDLMADRAGGVYVTDMPAKKVWYIPAGGTKRTVAEGFTPNGLTLWQDGGTLVVADWDNPYLRTFRRETNGDLKFGAPYYSPLQLPPGQEKPGSDGMTVDDAGRLYVCTHAGLQMFDPTGRLGGAIAKPQNKFLSNVEFGGPKFDTLYVTCTDKVYKRKTKVTGTPHFLWKPPAK